MPYFKRDDINIYYEESGQGFPVLLFAAGGMNSAMGFWEKGSYNPITKLAGEFRVIAMDQRNAPSGQSTAPVTAGDGWHSYTEDHVALLDHLGIERCHIIGQCIGGPYGFGLIQAAPKRVASFVAMQTIGLENNREAFYQMFDNWAGTLRKQRDDVTEEALGPFRSAMYDGDFLFNVSREFIRECPAPLLVLMGKDLYHPESTSREVARLAPDATLIEAWKEPEHADATHAAIAGFLRRHS